MANSRPISSIGIIGFGAFGRLIARHISPYLSVLATDALPLSGDLEGAIESTLAEVCLCDVVVIATPVHAMREICRSIALLLLPGCIVMDIGSVKIEPAATMLEDLPDYVEILATHPLFGPNSTLAGMDGLKMVACPLRGCRWRRLLAFLRMRFGISILLTSPEEHDREAALSQGLTHLLAKVLLGMGPLPKRITTRSFDLIVQAIDMVANDAPGVTMAIEKANPFAGQARSAFFERLAVVRDELA